MWSKLKSRSQINIFFGFWIKCLGFCRIHGWLMENIDKGLTVHCYKNDSLGHRVWLEVPTVWMKNHRKLRDERRKSTWDSYPNSLDIIGQLVCTYAQQHECRILKCWMKQFAIKCLISQHQKQYWSPNSLHWLHQIVVATLQFFGAIPTSRY